MKYYTIEREQLLPISIEEAWNFFSTPLNLYKITPEKLNLRVQSKVDVPSVYEGMEINYKVKPLWGMTFNWGSIIKNINAPTSFTDIQTKGPYAYWEHQHYFIKAEGGTIVKDVIKYAMPFGILGRMIHALVIKSKLKEIFEYRVGVLNNLFPKKQS